MFGREIDSLEKSHGIRQTPCSYERYFVIIANAYNIVKWSYYFGSCPATTFWKTPMQEACLPSVISGDDTRLSSRANDFIAISNWPICDTHSAL